MPTTWSTTDKTANLALSGGNLIATATDGSAAGVRAADGRSSGKFYWEVTTTTWGGVNNAVGITSGGSPFSNSYQTPAQGAGSCVVLQGGTIYSEGTSTALSIGSLTNGSVACIALDLDNQRIWFRNGAAGNWNGSAANNPATGVGGVTTTMGHGALTAYPTVRILTVNNAATANFTGTFAGAVPAGFTSGFPTGTPALIAATTQAAIEHWAIPNPQGQFTQAAIEHWVAGSPWTVLQLTQFGLEQWGTAPSGAQLTQLAVEEWATVANQPARALLTQIGVEMWAQIVTGPATAPQTRVMILA